MVYKPTLIINSLNAEIESGYKKKKPTLDLKDSKGRTYKIDFQNMIECVVDAHGNPLNKQIKIRRHDQTKGIIYIFISIHNNLLIVYRCL